MARRAEPPDGGWGWMVVLSAFFQSALVFGVLRSFGVFFVEFVAAFEEQAARVSWIASIGIAVQQFGSPIGSALSTKLGPRPVVMTGGILAALGMLLASFATSLTHLYLSIGLLSGSGWALTFTPTLACLSRYFSRRRSLAMGLALTGVGLSSFAFAPLFQWLISSYAWRGALLLVSALSLHLMACGALLRPLSLTEDTSVGGPGAQLSSLLHHGPFLRYTVALTLINTGYFIPYVHLVAHLQDLGWDPLPAAFLLSVAAISDLVGRVASGWLGDAVPGPVARLLMLWTTLTGVSLALFPVAQAPTTLVVLAVAYGFTSGALTPVAFSVLPELVGTARIYCGLGLVQMIESIGGLLGAPLSVCYSIQPAEPILTVLRLPPGCDRQLHGFFYGGWGLPSCREWSSYHLAPFLLLHLSFYLQTPGPCNRSSGDQNSPAQGGGLGRGLNSTRRQRSWKARA
ncbi:monocarboxylate transporter 13 isoform X1 [Arvicola amphibius]|uniref:monocarboxylate transporter 13 isoform X1 n=1 Tax=Arvicola amphibius TaxID=1047088 RepID=UPI0018E38098|nr:monocarboxylate transporter 13 isoform X1 [Arvicola amphibius]